MTMLICLFPGKLFCWRIVVLRLIFYLCLFNSPVPEVAGSFERML